MASSNERGLRTSPARSTADSGGEQRVVQVVSGRAPGAHDERVDAVDPDRPVRRRRSRTRPLPGAARRAQVVDELDAGLVQPGQVEVALVLVHGHRRTRPPTSSAAPGSRARRAPRRRRGRSSRRPSRSRAPAVRPRRRRARPRRARQRTPSPASAGRCGSAPEASTTRSGASASTSSTPAVDAVADVAPRPSQAVSTSIRPRGDLRVPRRLQRQPHLPAGRAAALEHDHAVAARRGGRGRGAAGRAGADDHDRLGRGRRARPGQRRLVARPRIHGAGDRDAGVVVADAALVAADADRHRLAGAGPSGPGWGRRSSPASCRPRRTRPRRSGGRRRPGRGSARWRSRARRRAA